MYKADILSGFAGRTGTRDDDVTAEVRRAEQFWLGEAVDVYRAFPEFKPPFGVEGFLRSPWAQYLRVPFPQCLFCFSAGRPGAYGDGNVKPWQHLSTKRAVLVMRHSDGTELDFAMIYHDDVVDRWYAEPHMYRCWPSEARWEVDDSEVPLASLGLSDDDAGMDAYYRRIEKEDAPDVAATLAGIVLLNCRNVVTERTGGADQAVNRRRAAKGKKPILSYHVLKVGGMVPRSEGGRPGSGIMQRIHLCRGHFKRYTPERPLFGRYHGLFWWEPCVRGTDKSGMVVKDYDASTMGSSEMATATVGEIS